ncbi:MAG TPA: addiction module protein [Prolixibacteraceae bacterium]|jgi:hypothetical protein|nr:addiction module protein [Prolixibacteraceae bacterium]
MRSQPDIEELTKNIINLPKKERLEIARFILFLDNRSSETDVDSLWENEIIKRANAVKDGTAKGVDFLQAMKSIDSRFV